MDPADNSFLNKFHLVARLPIKGLVSIGFGLAVLPLLLGFFSAYKAVENLVSLSQQTIYNVAQQVQNSRQIVEKAISLERKGKQFLVLDDLASLDWDRNPWSTFRQQRSCSRCRQ